MNKILLLVCCSLFITGSCQAREIPEKDAVRAILGEARGEGYKGMYAVACAIRNRGDLRGVYGFKASMEHIDGKTREIALNACKSSLLGVDVTHGAQFWEGVKFKKPSWAYGMTRTVRIGRQDFYREG